MVRANGLLYIGYTGTSATGGGFSVHRLATGTELVDMVGPQYGKDGYGITDKAHTYLQPLIRGEAYPPYGTDGLPKYVALKNVAVKKKLPAWEG